VPTASPSKSTTIGTHAVVEAALQIERLTCDAGTAGFVTTGLPSAASVGASSADSNAISKISSQGNTIAANKKPSTIVSGKPISSSRSGSPRLRLTTAKSAFAASVNSTMASVISARRRNPSPLISMRSTRNPSGPRIKPTPVNTIGPLNRDRSTRPAIAL
jgi:hypothetical protein